MKLIVLLVVVILFCIKWILNLLGIPKVDPREYFAEIRVINLKRRPDRLLKWTQKYSDSDVPKDLKFKVVEAVDGSKLDMSSDIIHPDAQREMILTKRRGHRLYHYEITPGAVGCYLSHVEVWKECANSGVPFLVMEDDYGMSRTFWADLSGCLGQVPDDSDIILLNRNHVIDYSILFWRGCIQAEQFFSTIAYIITPRACAQILESPDLFPIRQQIDLWISDHTDTLDVYAPLATPDYTLNDPGTDIQIPIQTKNTGKYTFKRTHEK